MSVTFPEDDAKCNAVAPKLSGAFVFAPCSNNILVIRVFPLYDATCSAVHCKASYVVALKTHEKPRVLPPRVVCPSKPQVSSCRSSTPACLRHLACPLHCRSPSPPLHHLFKFHSFQLAIHQLRLTATHHPSLRSLLLNVDPVSPPSQMSDLYDTGTLGFLLFDSYRFIASTFNSSAFSLMPLLVHPIPRCLSFHHRPVPFDASFTPLCLSFTSCAP